MTTLLYLAMYPTTSTREAENELYTNLVIFSTREPLEDREFAIFGSRENK